MLKEIEQRQSIRKYLNKPVEPEKILELLKAAMNAPTARNTQEWKFKVITNSQALNDMTKLSPYTTMMKEAPCAILVIADLNKAVNQGLGCCWCGIAPVSERVEGFKNYYNLADNEYPVGVVAVGYSNETKPLIDRFDSKNISYFK